jgi:aryl-alcohol dehydrogenase-like predicted oxidoreductase
MTNRSVELGLGLLSIGRPWGAVAGQPPSEIEAMRLLETAVALGIRFFDTAPAYGDSEQRFGSFLRQLDPGIFAQLMVATKCGIHWDFASQRDYDDHSYDALCRSIDQSALRLPRIDLLQLHRASVETIASSDVRKAFDYARSIGIPQFGVSVKDLPAARLAVDDGRFKFIQLPFNIASASMEAVIGEANASGKKILANRPFSMGALLYDDAGQPKTGDIKRSSFEFILQRDFSGVILTGTKSSDHLRENVAAFRDAVEISKGPVDRAPRPTR